MLVGKERLPQPLRLRTESLRLWTYGSIMLAFAVGIVVSVMWSKHDLEETILKDVFG